MLARISLGYSKDPSSAEYAFFIFFAINAQHSSISPTLQGSFLSIGFVIGFFILCI